MNLLETYSTGEYKKTVTRSYNPALGLTTIKYVHAGVDFNNPLYRQARGLTLDNEGNIILRGFNKFFNHRELDNRESYTEDFKNTYARLTVKPDEPVTFYEKLDGTMIITGLYHGEVITATSRSTRLPYNMRANTVLGANQKLVEWLTNNPDYCLVFEYVAPDNIIGVYYEEEDYVLIGVIDKNTGDSDINHVMTLGEELGYTTPRMYTMTLNEVTRLQVEATGIEGYVVYNTAGNLIKFKTQDWFYHAKLRTTIWGEEYTKNKVAAIIRAYQEDDLDDLWAAQNQPMNTGNLDALTPVVTRIQSWEAKVQEIYDKFQELVAEHGDAQARIMTGRSPEYPNHLKAVMFNAVQEGTTSFFTGESGARSLLKLVLTDLPKTIPTKEQLQ